MTRTSPDRPRATRRRARIAVAAALVAVAATAVTAALSAASAAPGGGQRIDMKVLLLATSAGDANATAWEDNLKREGTPYARLNGDTTTLTAAELADGDHALYQAVIVSGSDGTYSLGRPGATAFTEAEWTTLHAFESTFGIRQLDVNAFPGPSLGTAGNVASGTLDGGTATVNAEGKAQFPDLAGTVSFEDLDPAVSETFGAAAAAGGCLATDAACAATSYTPLVTSNTAPFNGLPIVGVSNMKDGRQEMVSTFSANQFQLHDQILRHALLGWVTGGVYIGRNRTFFSMDVDDVFLPDTKWDPATNQTPGDGTAVLPDVHGTFPGEVDTRMLPSDATNLVAWQNSEGVKLNLLFNGVGHTEFQQDPANTAGTDPLFDTLKADAIQFHWINHTWSHASLGSPNPEVPSQATIQSEISQDIQFAQGTGADQLGLTSANFNPTELVTGEHSGIGTSKAALGPTGTVPVSAPTPAMAPALNALGITSIGADNSREDGQRMVGNAYTLSRYPMNVFYNVATMHDQLDEYDWFYLDKNAPYVDPTAGDVGVPRATGDTTTPPRGNCVNNVQTTCFETPVTAAQFVQRESAAVLVHLMGNDPHPTYAHQPNIMVDAANANAANRGDGILYQVLTPAIAAYRTYFDTAIQQPGMTALREELTDQTAWANTTPAQVSGYIQDGRVTIVSDGAHVVPITGTTFGDVYGGRRSGWLPVTAGTQTLELDQPRATVAPVVTGHGAVGSALTATDGTYTGTVAPDVTVITSRRWQRRAPGTGGAADGPWSPIPGATTPAYVVTAADKGMQLRFVTTAANRRATWGMALSAPLTIPGPSVVTPPVTTTSPSSGTASTDPPAARGESASAPGGAPSVPGAPPALKAASVPPAFTCRISRGRKVSSLSCTVRSTAGGLRSARLRAVRGRHVLGVASGRVKGANRMPVLRVARTQRRHEARITITVRLRNGRLRSMTRTLSL
jgi:hypothetical protein